MIQKLKLLIRDKNNHDFESNKNIKDSYCEYLFKKQMNEPSETTNHEYDKDSNSSFLGCHFIVNNFLS